VDQAIAELCHTNEPRDKVGRKGTGFPHYTKCVGIIFRCPKAVLAYQMMTKVERCLDGYDK